MNDELQGLSAQAVKLMRRLQALPKGRTYILILTKHGDAWHWSIAGDGKIEQGGSDE